MIWLAELSRVGYFFFCKSDMAMRWGSWPTSPHSCMLISVDSQDGWEHANEGRAHVQSIYPQVLCSYSSVAFPVSFVSLKHWQCSLHCTSLVLPHKPFSFMENKYTVLTEILPFITQINLYTVYLMLEADPKISREFEDCFGKSCLPYWLPFHFRALVLTAFLKGLLQEREGTKRLQRTRCLSCSKLLP